MFANVIAGVDGRDGGRDAVALATALGSGRLTLVNAYPADAVRSRASLAGYEELQREESQRTLQAARLEAAVDADLVAEPDSSPARALQRVAYERSADLIVLGSAHHGPLGRILLGDVGRALVHGAPCPVAMAPKQQSSVPPRSIAVGFDGSVESRAALDVAQSVTAEHGAALTLYVVWEDPSVPVAVGAGSAEYVDRARSDRRRWAEDLLADTLASLPGRTAGHVLHGRPGVELEKVADQHYLVVVGSRRWGPIARVALGSTSDRLAHRAPSAVLVVPRPVADVSPVAPATAASAG